MTLMRRHNFASVRWLLAVAALGLLVTCVKPVAETATAEPQAVAFDAYLSRGVTTRAGYAGILDNASLEDEGFGVFAYYTQGIPYNHEVEPNFMYNTSVTNPSGANWQYSPIKYWPNESSATTSGLVDRVSFFAYAPYVEVDPLTGRLTSGNDTAGILQLTTSIDKNDPKVTYRSSFVPTQSVDLCWALPHLNVERPADVNTPVSLQFYHALSALNMQIDAAIDELTPGSKELDSPTRIYVRYVTLEGCATQGILNLNNASTTPDWAALTGLSFEREVTVHDGRLDGLEARYEDTAESPTGLNQGIIQMNGYNYRPGVTNTLRNLFDTNDYTKPVFVIPNGYPLAVTIEYDVETRDDKLQSSHLGDGTTHGSVTTVRVRQLIDSGGDPLRLEAGKKYVIRMHLGMTSVKFEAGLTDEWAEDHEIIILHPVTMGQEVIVHTAADEGNEWH